MQIKAIVKSLLASYFTTILCLILLALLLYQFELGKTPVSIGIVCTYVLSCLLGGILIGKKMQNKRFLWGLFSGLCYYLVLLLISFGFSDGIRLSFQHAATTCFLCLAGGTLGGMLS